MGPNPLDLPLRDIHLPEAISWWPLAFGWWLLLAAILLLGCVIFLIVKRCLKSTLRKEARQSLQRIEKSFEECADARRCLCELSAFLRRVKLSQKKSDKIAGLTGHAWLKVLDEPLGTQEFSEGVGKLLLIGPYSPQVINEDVGALIQLCRKWVEKL